MRFDTQPERAPAETVAMTHPNLKYRIAMLERRWLVVALVSLGMGCTKSNPAATCDQGSCIDPNFPYCDADGSISGEPGSCVAVSCEPGAPNACHGDMLQMCNAAGNGYDLSPCDLGCSEVPKPHCKYLQPKYMPDICDTAAAIDRSDYLDDRNSSIRTSTRRVRAALSRKQGLTSASYTPTR